MEKRDIDIILEHYAKVFRKESKSTNPVILKFFEEVVGKHSLENILKSIDLAFKDVEDKPKIHPAHLIKILQENLNRVEQFSPSLASSKTLSKTLKDYESRVVWKNLFDKLKIDERKVIDDKELLEIPKDLINFYISAKLANYLYKTLDEGERTKIDNFVQKKINTLNFNCEREKEEAKALLTRYFVKKFYNIPF